MKGKQVRNVLIQVVCTAAVFLLTVGFGAMMLGAFHLAERFDEQGSVHVYTAEAVVNVPFKTQAFLYLCGFALVFYVLFRFAFAYDPVMRRLGTEEIGFFQWIGRVLSTPSFLCEFAVILLLLVFLPARFLAIKKYFPIAVYPVVLAVFFIAYVGASLQGNFAAKRRMHPMEIVNGIAIRFLLAFFGSALSFPIVLIAYATIFRAYGNRGVFITLAALILCPFLFLYLRAVRKRRRLLRRLKKLCDEKEFSLEYEKVYRSILFPNKEPEIRIRTGEGTFACKLLNTFMKKTQLFLTAFDSDLLVGHGALGHRATRYSFDPDDKRILLLIPVPLFIYWREDGGWRPLYAAEKVGDYTVYSAAAFLNALDMNALEAARKKREW